MNQDRMSKARTKLYIAGDGYPEGFTPEEIRELKGAKAARAAVNSTSGASSSSKGKNEQNSAALANVAPKAKAKGKAKAKAKAKARGKRASADEDTLPTEAELGPEQRKLEDLPGLGPKKDQMNLGAITPL